MTSALTLTPQPRCHVCAAVGPVERHHLAPRNLFGDAEAERWPTVLVCRPCHERWHAVVDRSIERGRRARAGLQQRRAEQVRRDLATRSSMPWIKEERAANEAAIKRAQEARAAAGAKAVRK